MKKEEEEVFLQQYGPGGTLFHIVAQLLLHCDES